MPHGMTAESAALFAQNIPSEVRATPAPQATPQPTEVPIVEQQSATMPLQSIPQLPVKTAAPVSYVYFYTGGLAPAAPAPIAIAPAAPVVFAPMPVVHSYSAPVFFPQVVPSRVGAPKLVYTNGVVIKPKVYYPHQPIRNSFRGFTP